MILEEPPTRQAIGLPIAATEPIVSPVPDPKWVKGHCPACSAPLVDNTYYAGGVGFYSIRQCWNALQEPASCDTWDFFTAFGPANWSEAN